MSYLSDLQWKLAQRKQEKSECEAELKVQRKRRTDLRSLKIGLDSTAGSYLEGMNGNLNSVTTQLPIGVAINQIFVARSTDMQKTKEQDATQDAHLQDALSNIESERTAVDKKIEELEERISRLNTDIWQTEQNIETERSRLAEEAARAAAASKPKRRK